MKLKKKCKKKTKQKKKQKTIQGICSFAHISQTWRIGEQNFMIIMMEIIILEHI